MARPVVIKNSLVVSTRFEAELYRLVQDIAALETANRGKKISAQELIREAVKYVYEDGERFRECFRRTRQNAAKRFK